VCRVHRTYMGHIERGEKNLSFQSMVRVANALNVPLSELFRGLEDGEPPPARISGVAKTPNRNPRHEGVDRDRLIREVASLEKVLSGLKELVSVSDPRTISERRKGTGKGSKRKI
jgi:transcriptional regulator with XRE-family HTH domain